MATVLPGNDDAEPREAPDEILAAKAPGLRSHALRGDDLDFEADALVAQTCHAMPDVLQQMAQVLGDVVIEQEGHESAGDICRATSTSISPR